MDEKFVSGSAVARRARVSLAIVNEWITSGRIRAQRQGKGYRVVREDAERVIDEELAEQEARMDRGFTSIAKLAERCSVTRQAVWKWIQDGRIRGVVQMGSVWRIPNDEANHIVREGISRESHDRPDLPMPALETLALAA